jgi:UDP-N-acetylmuramyl tripeptide synthase
LRSPDAAPPFDDSRRLTGCNLFFDGPGAVLEAAPVALAAGVIEAWRACVAQARDALDWPAGTLAARRHAHGATLALAAPLDQLFTATEVNEWALWAALQQCGVEAGPRLHAPGDPAAWNGEEALATLAAMARAECDPALPALAEAAAQHGIDMLVDDDTVSLGSGRGGRSWPRHSVPGIDAVEWGALSDVPITLVTGSNGKTTTTRLVATMLQAHGLRTAHTCTDGVFVDGTAIEPGDYSGPAGARLALRQPDIDAAVLETARGGILRRGIAPTRADVAIVTNISDDHFGEYGIDNLDDLADVKLTVVRPLGEHGTLVLTADVDLLLPRAPPVHARLALFALDADAPALVELRARGGSTCGLRDGRLLLEHLGDSHDLGAIEAMPLSFGGAAHYNVSNIAAAVLAADVLDVGADTLRAVLASFGSRRGDNPGRLEHFSVGGIEILIDYAHNPDGMRSLLAAAAHVRRGRMGLLLGQAGDRDDDEVRALANVAAAEGPDFVVLKDLPGYLRGRADGEVPRILRDALLKRGVEAARITIELDEWQALRNLLAWARAGDTLVLPVHGKRNRPRVTSLLETLARNGWHAGDALPTDAR